VDKARHLQLFLIGSQCLIGLTLLLWPFVALASVMGLAGHRSGHEPALEVLLANTFYISTIVYPLPFAVCSILAWVWYGRGNLTRAWIAGLITPVWVAAMIIVVVIGMNYF
jgi:hypothetical protein